MCQKAGPTLSRFTVMALPTITSAESMAFVVLGGTGEAVLRYGCCLERHGKMVLAILSGFDKFVTRNNNVVRASSSP
ncbi:TPA: hypothetical protein MH604_00190 [Klebsiella pneumoniae]|nr:hypothetical protein [Klebsiella pneumoniae]